MFTYLKWNKIVTSVRYFDVNNVKWNLLEMHKLLQGSK